MMIYYYPTKIETLTVPPVPEEPTTNFNSGASSGNARSVCTSNKPCKRRVNMRICSNDKQ